MPLKIRCRGCEKVLNVPDRARGKAIRCPSCQTTIRIPAAKAEAGSPAAARDQKSSQRIAQENKRSVQEIQQKSSQKREPSRRRRPARVAAIDGDNFLDGVDLRRAADSRVRVCAKCGAEAPEVEEDEEEVVDCPECGHNIDTGVLSDYQRIKRSRKGPDPEEFWGKIWSEPWAFLKKNLSVVFRTAGIWSFFQASQICCFYVAVNFADKFETRTVWFSLGALWTLGVGGWLWLTMTRIIRHTMSPQRNKKYKETDFDYFQCFALGYKSVFWALIVAYPITLTLTVLYLIPVVTPYAAIFDSYMPIYISSGVVLVFCLSVFPVAMIHMSMPYTYKAWLPVNLVMMTAKNIVPSLCWLLVFFTVLSPVIILLVILQFSYGNGLEGALTDGVNWIAATCGDMSQYILKAIGLVSGFLGKVILGPLFLVILFFLMLMLTAFPICTLLAFPLVYSMRAIGLVALYFRQDLELVSETTAGESCGFGPRYVAAQVDSLVLMMLLAVLYLIVFLAGLLFSAMGAAIPATLALYIFPIVGGIIIPCLYFARPQSASTIRASIGKWSLGIVVTDDKDDPMTFNLAISRYFTKFLLTVGTLGASSIVAAFSADKQALHDGMRQTKVVWKGDDERKRLE